MPKTRKIRRSGGRGKTRKVKKGAISSIVPTRSTTVNVNRALAPIAQRYVTKMKYAQAFTLPGATGLQTYRWRLNSINDPDAIATGGTNGAHRPNGYAPLFGNAVLPNNPNGLYNRYRVISCKYIVTCANDSFNIQYGVLPTNDATPPMTNMSEVRENPRVKYRLQNIGGTLKKLTGSVYLPSLMGRTAAQYMADDSYGAIANQNPSEFAFLDLYVQGLNDDTGSVMQHSVNIMLIYTVECYDLRTQDQAPAPTNAA